MNCLSIRALQPYEILSDKISTTCLESIRKANKFIYFQVGSQKIAWECGTLPKVTKLLVQTIEKRFLLCVFYFGLGQDKACREYKASGMI